MCETRSSFVVKDNEWERVAVGTRLQKEVQCHPPILSPLLLFKSRDFYTLGLDTVLEIIYSSGFQTLKIIFSYVVRIFTHLSPKMYMLFFFFSVKDLAQSFLSRREKSGPQSGCSFLEVTQALVKLGLVP